MNKLSIIVPLLLYAYGPQAQLRWQPVDSMNRGLPASVKVFRSTDSIEGRPNIAWYISADLNDTSLVFDTDTTLGRRLTPRQFYDRNPALVVVNGTFFSFQTNQNLNTVIKNGRPVSFNIRSVRGRGADSVRQILIHRSALGIRNRQADIAWISSDTAGLLRAAQQPVAPYKTLAANATAKEKRQWQRHYRKWKSRHFKSWPMETAIGGGPVLLQNGQLHITNENEMMFTGRGLHDRHPRTAMGYTARGRLIILVIQGRMKGLAEGATLAQEALILNDLGCTEALNLDGGGSSCMLVNGQETIKPADAAGQRPVPAVFMIKKKNIE